MWHKKKADEIITCFLLHLHGIYMDPLVLKDLWLIAYLNEMLRFPTSLGL